MAAATPMTENKISLKVMVHKEKNKVIFAEADNNFVNALFSIMTLPLATLVRVLEKCCDDNLKAFRCLKNLYQSLMKLSAGYLTNDENKYLMLNPRTSGYDYCRNLEHNIDDTEPTKYFVCQGWVCNRHCFSFSICSLAKCVCCGSLMNTEIKDLFDDEDYDDGGFVHSLATFIVADDLRVMPNTSDVSIQLLCDLGFTDASDLEERTIDIGREQMVILVKAVLLYKYPLTYLVFHSIHPSGVLVNDPKLATPIPHLTINENGTNLKKMTLRVTLQKSTSKFLFAEAEEDLVDFLFGFLEIPLGTLIGKLMNENTSFESLDNLFASISNMSVGEYVKSQDLKDMLIKPQLVLKYVSENQIFPLNVTKSYLVLYHQIDMILKIPRLEGRYLKSPTKFMLTDDLVVTPISSISVIAIMNKLKVPLDDVEQHAIVIGILKRV